MGKYHRIVTKIEGQCLMCGRCCGNCVDLVKRKDKLVCGGQTDKPEACRRFPLDYSVELIPSQCGFRIVRTRKVDEAEEGERIRVSGRTSLAVVKGIAADDDEVFPDIYDLQTRVTLAEGSLVYRKSPKALARMLRRLADDLVSMEAAHSKRKPLPSAEWESAEQICKEAIEAILAYAERRDIACGDLFPADDEEKE